MSKLPLTFACGRYDRMWPLFTGEVEPEGIDLNFIGIDYPREIFDRMVGGLEFDVAEMSTSEFVCHMASGNNPFVAIPVFPSKAFRHGFICVNRNAGIETPKDLEGRRVGTPLYTQTAAIWIRGHLRHQYGVDLSRIHWVQGAVEKPGAHGDPHALPLLKPVEIEINTADKSLGDLLAEGAIDALLGSRMPENFGTHPDVVRLFSDYVAEERRLYEEHRIHPIMHLVVIRRELYDRHPWVAASLYKAMCESKDREVRRMNFTAAQHLMLPWLFRDLDEIREVFGGDPWRYGVEANRPTLAALVQYMVEQDFIPAPIPVEDLFVPVYPAG